MIAAPPPRAYPTKDVAYPVRDELVAEVRAMLAKGPTTMAELRRVILKRRRARRAPGSNRTLFSAVMILRESGAVAYTPGVADGKSGCPAGTYALADQPLATRRSRRCEYMADVPAGRTEAETDILQSVVRLGTATGRQLVEDTGREPVEVYATLDALRLARRVSLDRIDCTTWRIWTPDAVETS